MFTIQKSLSLSMDSHYMLFFLDKFIFYFLFLIPFSTDSVELVNPNNGEFTELEEVKSYEKPEDSTNICYQG